MATAPEHFAPLPELVVRPMAEADVTEVVAIEFASYRFPWSEGIFRDCLRVGYVCRIGMLGGLVAGYGIASCGAAEAHILNLCVRAELRCRGIGTLLLEDLLQRAAASAVDVAYLEVRPSNTAAIRLYQSFKFEHIGMRRGYYQAPDGREDAAVFKLALRNRRCGSG
ncbi:MAG TPA: ribosomal protein S18-alanine N-acetyltransferase [Steroidobacteraceae bacterium]|jgi:ribosomal-protein-alanine N-acetyltransferase